MLELGFKVFISYLAGSLNGALLVGKLYGGVDIRKLGSGNAGGTNALRTQGKLFAALVILVDIGKGVLPVLLLPAMAIPLIGIDSEVSRHWLMYACAGAAIFGHCYPVWFEFAGGKGAATALGVLAVVAPGVMVPAMLTWFGTLLFAGYVGLATVLAAASVPLYLAWTNWNAHSDLMVFTGALAAFVLYTHRSNMRKLVTGQSRPDVRFGLLQRFG